MSDNYYEPREDAARIPAEVFHPSVFINEEMQARGWTRDTLAMRMGPRSEFGINRGSLDLYLEVGPIEPNLRIGEISAKALACAFGVSPDLFLNLEQAWLEWQRANE